MACLEKKVSRVREIMKRQKMVKYHGKITSAWNVVKERKTGVVEVELQLSRLQ